ncbi:hypothetical protein [Phytopseudomonas daroniae]|uniref:hypothetical protein n=1 Tax=Phytopseudomonas daroniae TaxID=2487519 RepID=UPI001038356A|nr:hypothetical protein [Pseudomonas daroniae]
MSLDDHIAGATVRHANPFAGLEVPCRREPLEDSLREGWVVPLYFGLHTAKAREHLARQLGEADEQLARRLLEHFDWCPRSIGAHLAAMGAGQCRRPAAAGIHR